MLTVMEVSAGLMLGLGALAAVFWLTFRNPSPIDKNASDRLSSDGYMDQSISTDGFDGHH